MNCCMFLTLQTIFDTITELHSPSRYNDKIRNLTFIRSIINIRHSENLHKKPKLEGKASVWRNVHQDTRQIIALL